MYLCLLYLCDILQGNNIQPSQNKEGWFNITFPKWEYANSSQHYVEPLIEL